MGKLREQMKGELELKRLSQNTQEIYLRQASLFSRHFSRSPRHLGEREIKGYLLILSKKIFLRKKGFTTVVKYVMYPLRFSPPKFFNFNSYMIKLKKN